MNKTKVMIFFALFGFVLSFVTGLIASVSFGVLILRALLCAAVSVGLYFAASFVYARFLANPGEQHEEIREPSSDGGKKHRVDITLGDSVLPEDENGPLFKIPKDLMPNADSFTNDAGLSDAEMSGAESQSQSFVPPQSFTSDASGENASGVPIDGSSFSQSADAGATGIGAATVGSGAETVAEQSYAAAQESAGGQSSAAADAGGSPNASAPNESELGSLPDMENVFSSIKNPTGDVITNSDFAKAGATATSDELKNADTEIMAKAIHTVLARAQD